MTAAEHELYVQSLYQALGYRVKRNFQLRGQQCDLEAQRHVEGLGIVKILIECKFTEKLSVSNQEVQDFVSTFRSLPKGLGYTKGVVVTNAEFSSHSKSVVEGHDDISLQTTLDLESDIFNVTESYIAFTRDYERDPDSSSYISLSTDLLVGDPFTGKGQTTRLDKVDRWLEKAIEEQQVSLCTVLGDYGAGKSTLLKHIKYLFSIKYLRNPSGLRPILFLLKDYAQARSLNEFIVQTLQREFLRPIPAESFFRFANAGRFLLLLDGFDEMGREVNKQVRARQFIDLSPLFTSSSPCLLTCRPSYFVSHREYVGATQDLLRHASIEPFLPEMSQRNLFDRTVDDLHERLFNKFVLQRPRTLPIEEFLTLRLSPLGAEQVDEFLKKYDGTFQSELGIDWVTARDFIYSVYDLSDLVSRPVLLQMIVQTILGGALDVHGADSTVSPSVLYELYTSLSLDADWHKGETRQLLPREERRHFAIGMAIAMLDDDDATKVSFDRVLTVLDHLVETQLSIRNAVESHSFEVIASDLQICSFLTRGQDDQFRFIHKSFYEYFVAIYLAERIRKGECDNRFTKPLPKGVLYFLCSLGIDRLEVRRTIIKWIAEISGSDSVYPPGSVDNERRMVLENLVNGILGTGEIHRISRLEGLTLDRLDMKMSRLEEIKFIRCDFQRVKLQEVNWIRCNAKDVSWNEVDYNSGYLHNCRFDLRMELCSIVSILITRSTVALTAVGLSVSQCNFEDSEVSITGDVDIANTSFSRCRLSMSYSSGYPIDLESTHILSGTVFIAPSKVIPEIRQCKFDQCESIALRGQLEDLMSCDLTDCFGFVALQGKRHSGAEISDLNAVEIAFGVDILNRDGVVWFDYDVCERNPKYIVRVGNAIESLGSAPILKNWKALC